MEKTYEDYFARWIKHGQMRQRRGDHGMELVVEATVDES